MSFSRTPPRQARRVHRAKQAFVAEVAALVKFDVMRIQAEQSESEHHPGSWRQVQEVVEAHCDRNRDQEQHRHDNGAILERDLLVPLVWLTIAYGKAHEDRRHQPVDERR